MRAELSSDNIHITIVSPGRIKTDVSKNALTKDGTAHGEMDQGQEQGMAADVCAAKIISAVKKNKKELLVGRNELWMVHIRKYLPSLYYRLVKSIRSK